MYSLNSPAHKVNFLQRIKNFFGIAVGSEDYESAITSDIYKHIVAEVPLLISAKDRAGKYTMANQSFCDLLGMPAELIIGKNDIEIGLFLNPDQIINADLQVFETGQKKHIPLEPYTDRYGTLFWFKTTKSPLFNEKGEFNEILIVSTDITERLDKEQRLSKSELRYKSIFENNYSGIIVVDQDLNIINKNKAFNKLIEIDQRLLNKDDLKKYLFEEDRNDLIDLMVGLVSRNYEYFDLNLVLNTKGGNKVDTICFVRGLYDEHEGFNEAVVTFQDITKEIRNLKELEESEKRFRVIVENASEALMLLDFDSKLYIDTNKSAEILFGYEHNELLDQHLGELSPINQANGRNSKELAGDYMQQALKGKNVVYEWIARRKDGKLIPCEVRLVRLPFKNRSIIRTSVVDITERKKAEHLLTLEKQKIQEANNELVDVNHRLENQTNQLQEFAYIASHNLRSPAGNIRALLDFYQSDPTAENFNLLLTKLDVVSIDLMDTINDLAEVVKIKNEISQEIVSVSLQKVIDKTKDSLSEVFKAKKAKVIVNLEQLQTILASKTYVESIILNLMSNALKYSKEDIAPIIKISAELNGDWLEIIFKDNGLGINLNKFGNKIFGLRKTFHRKKDSRGLGLFITRAQVEAMGGSISVESEPLKGCTFIIKLPKKIIDD